MPLQEEAKKIRAAEEGKSLWNGKERREKGRKKISRMDVRIGMQAWDSSLLKNVMELLER